MAKFDLRVLAVIGMFVVAVLFMSGGLKSVFAQGFTVDSISLANPAVQGQPNEWIVSASLTGWGQNIIGNLGVSDIQYGGATAQYPLSISGSISKNQGYYLIDNSNPKDIYKYRVVAKTGTITKRLFGLYYDVTPAPACDGNPNYQLTQTANELQQGIFGSTGGDTILSRWCIYRDNIGAKSEVSALPNIVPEIDLSINANGQQENVKLTGLGAYSFKNGYGSASWTNSPVQAGSLGALSIGTQYVAISPINGNTWKVAYRNDYEGGGAGQSWSNAVSSAESTYSSFVNLNTQINSGCRLGTYDTNGVTVANECGRKYLQDISSNANSLADGLLNSNVNINNRMTIYAADGGQKGFWVDLGNIYAAAPKLQFRIKSQWIGILFPSGEPQIVSATASPYPFKSGDPLNVNIQVKNIGSGTGSFVAQDFSCGSMRPNSQVYPVSISAGQTGNIMFGMSMSYVTEESGVCSGKVVETGSQKSASWSFSYKAEKPVSCIEGKLYFLSNVIYKCINGQLVSQTNCQYGAYTDTSGNWVCNEPPSDFCKNNPTDPKCQPPADFPITYVIFPTLGGLLFYLINKKDRIIWGVMGGIVGLIAAFIVDFLLKNILLTIFGVVFGGILIWLLVGGGLMTVVAIMIAARKR